MTCCRRAALSISTRVSALSIGNLQFRSQQIHCTSPVVFHSGRQVEACELDATVIVFTSSAPPLLLRQGGLVGSFHRHAEQHNYLGHGTALFEQRLQW